MAVVVTATAYHGGVTGVWLIAITCPPFSFPLRSPQPQTDWGNRMLNETLSLLTAADRDQPLRPASCVQLSCFISPYKDLCARLLRNVYVLIKPEILLVLVTIRCRVAIKAVGSSSRRLSGLEPPLGPLTQACPRSCSNRTKLGQGQCIIKIKYNCQRSKIIKAGRLSDWRYKLCERFINNLSIHLTPVFHQTNKNSTPKGYP